MDAAFFPSSFKRSALPFGPGVRPRAERDAASARRREARNEAAPDIAAPQAAGAALRLSGVSKRFGDKPVVSDLDLAIEAGEFVAVVGRSGCGKSTLLRLALGLETPDAGTLEIGGHAPGDAHGPTTRLVFQEPRLLPWASVAENVGLGASRDRPVGERAAGSEAALASVGLAGRGADLPAVLSGGQRQRVALARALVSRPAFLALDEPLGALDALTRIEMQALVETVWRTERFTALLVTHDVTEAVKLADRVLVMENGRIAHAERIDLPRPRRHDDAGLAAIEARILDRLLAK